MDVIVERRPPAQRRWGLVAAGAVVLATLVWLIPGGGVPAVAADTVRRDTVISGELVREVRGSGTLVAENQRFITALASARVERLLVESGAAVEAGQSLMVLSNPDVEIQALQADQAVSQARADLVALRSQLEAQRLTQEGTVATARTANLTASQESVAAESLLAGRLMSRFEAAGKLALGEEMATRLRVEQQRLTLYEGSADSLLEVARENVQRLREIAEFQRRRLDALQVRSPDAGVVQDLSLQLGEWVTEGTTLAKVVQPGRLKAALRLPESQAREVSVGQVATVDLHGVAMAGRVARKDPAAVAGFVLVDIALEGELPDGAVPDVNVTGTITVDRLARALSIARPSVAGGSGAVQLYRMVPGTDEAERTTVELGASTLTRVEVVAGLAEGDVVIISDPSAWGTAPRIRLK